MIVLDTNVVSELMKPRPQPAVRAWIERQSLDDCALASVTVAELLHGLRIMPEGARRAEKTAGVARFIDSLRVLPFGREAAVHFAVIAANRRAAGAPIGAFDAMIAAIARAHGATVATRDRRGFAGCGVDVIHPFDAG